jgi:integrase
MMRPRRRVRVARGLYRDQYGLAATVKVGRVQREQRFPSDEPLERIQAWQARTRADLMEDRDATRASDEPIPARGTFAGDLPRRLKQIAGRASYKSDRSHLQAWLPFVGPMKRTAIRPSHVRAAFTAWLTAGKSARTIRHRRRVFRELYQGLDGAHANPPIKGVKIPKPEDPHPTPVPRALIRHVAASLKKGKTGEKRHGPKRTLARVQYAEPAKARARFLVRATTGQRPAQIMRATSADVDLKRKIWFVRAGKGGHAIPLPLTPDMVHAWQAFKAADAWGPFDSRSFSKTLRRHGWPAHVRPYNLRHTFAIDHLLAGTSIGDLQGLLGHKQIETTRKHYAPVLLALLRKTVGRRTLKLA